MRYQATTWTETACSKIHRRFHFNDTIEEEITRERKREREKEREREREREK